MHLETILTVTGILVTLLFGAGGVYLALKRRYPGQITFLRETSLPLFDAIVKNLPELKVSFRERPVSEGLVLLKGALLNTGSKDITPDMVADNIAMTLPSGFRWITAKVTSHAPRVDCKIDFTPECLVFRTGLLRCKEYLRFEALAEVLFEKETDSDANSDIGERLATAIKVTHRIADTQKVVSLQLASVTRGQRRFKRFAVLVAAMAVVLGGLMATYLVRGWPAEMRFLMPTESGPIEVRARYRADGSVTLRGVKAKDYKKTLSAEDLLKTKGLSPRIVEQGSVKIMILVCVFYLIVPLLMCASGYREQRKTKRLRALLGIEPGDKPAQPTDPDDKE